MTLVSTAAKGTASVGRAVIFDSSLGADGPSIDTGANGIAAGYSIITVCIIGRTTQVAVSSSVSVRLNNDSGANYDQEFLQVANATITGGPSVGQTSWLLALPGASMDAGSAGLVSFAIPGYDATTFHKETIDQEGLSSGTAANNTNATRALRWRSTAAISRLAITAGSGNLLAGTRLLILGG